MAENSDCCGVVVAARRYSVYECVCASLFEACFYMLRCKRAHWHELQTMVRLSFPLDAVCFTRAMPSPHTGNPYTRQTFVIVMLVAHIKSLCVFCNELNRLLNRCFDIIRKSSIETSWLNAKNILPFRSCMQCVWKRDEKKIDNTFS